MQPQNLPKLDLDTVVRLPDTSSHDNTQCYTVIYNNVLYKSRYFIEGVSLVVRMLDIEGAAEFLQIHPESVRRMARNRRLPAFKVGREWRFKSAALEEWLDVQLDRAGERQVLVVDDEEAVLTVAAVTLGRAGYHVETTADGRSAIELVRNQIPDVLFLGLKVSGLRGVDILHEIKVLDPHLPVVIVTGRLESEFLQAALEYSPLLVLTKPVNTARLLDAAESAMAMRWGKRGTVLS